MSDTTAHFSNTIPTKRGANQPRRLGDIFKRLFDVLASTIGMILLSPFFTLFAIRIKRDSPGPIFYRGSRMGRNGKPFKIYKFRTMYEDNESYKGPPITAEDDPRVTPVGRWLRDTKLNELPQLLNVFKGEMSLVGPRPEDPEVVAEWSPEARHEVLSVRPGITSPASVIYRNEEGLLKNGRVMEIYLDDILPSKLRLDQLYVRHRSFWGDLDVIFWTFLVLLPKIGKYSPPEQSLLLGPISRLVRSHVSWFLADTLVTFIAMAVTAVIWRTFAPLNIGWPMAISLAIGFALLFSLVNAILGVNRIEWSKSAASDALDLVPGTILATIIALLLNYFYPTALIRLFYGGEVPARFSRPLVSSGIVIIATGIAFVGFIIVRYRTRLITGLATRWVAWRGTPTTSQERVLIVGGGETGQFAAWMLSNGTHADSLRVVGYVDDDLFIQGSRIHGLKVLGKRADIKDLVHKQDIGILVFAIHNISALERRRFIELCEDTSARVVVFPDIPAALNNIARNGGKQASRSASNPAPRSSSYDPNVDLLPCHLCLAKVSPIKVDNWLAQLEASSATGDLEELVARLSEMRAQLRSDVSAQIAANLGSQNSPNSPEGG